MEGTIIIRGGEAAMQDKRAQCHVDPTESEAVISVEANCSFSSPIDKARILSSMLDAFARGQMDRVFVIVAFMELEKMNMLEGDKNREQIVFPGDKNSPDGFSDVGMSKKLFDMLSDRD